MPQRFDRDYMVFNAAVTNNNDHRRNHALLRRQKGWRLSPAYDLVPAPLVSLERRDLALTVGNYGRTASIYNLLSQAGRFGLSPQGARGNRSARRGAASVARNILRLLGSGPGRGHHCSGHPTRTPLLRKTSRRVRRGIWCRVRARRNAAWPSKISDSAFVPPGNGATSIGDHFAEEDGAGLAVLSFCVARSKGCAFGRARRLADTARLYQERGHSKSPDVLAAIIPFSHQRMRAWQTKGDHVCAEIEGARATGTSRRAYRGPAHAYVWSGGSVTASEHETPATG